MKGLSRQGFNSMQAIICYVLSSPVTKSVTTYALHNYLSCLPGKVVVWLAIVYCIVLICCYRYLQKHRTIRSSFLPA